ncbi:MAG TPA: ABC-F family ATP-binding cassette domain-containing protein [Candidatus Saccharimonadales bacterium]|nr:ABC-F family ATP-binding cassette domain-containing protein [Candidatus Saccharimonadales bacterium]
MVSLGVLQVTISEKTIGSKPLLSDVKLWVSDNEKVGFLGRNGTGKTTLFNIITGRDTDFSGEVTRSKHEALMATSQEHHDSEGTTIEFVSRKLPDFARLETILQTYPEHMGDDIKKINVYTEALEKFSERGYYEVENSLEKLFDAYQLNKSLLQQPFISLSGGQKRLVELIAIQLAAPQIVLLDEPTNHMDYLAKEAFVEWLKTVKSSVLVISHDRDVLKNVDRILELKDQKIFSYPGNYDKYLAQNAVTTTNAINEFGTSEKRIANLKEQIAFAKARAATGGPRWVTLYERYERELNAILDNHQKPSFWIDRESAKMLKPKTTENYEKFRAKNIRLHETNASEVTATLLTVDKLSLGYGDTPLLENLSFQLSGGERMHIVGRNGVGKTTLVKAITQTWQGKRPDTLMGKGVIDCDRSLSISMYDQEIGTELLDMTLHDAIEAIYDAKELSVNEEQIKQDMANYLFNPAADRNVVVRNLSGGQKARLQLIRLLVGSPNLLILDEPTNHLDLPSIEELENALNDYSGAIIYITHDSYFAKNIGGEVLAL